jgi:molybdopterin molybdotransferase
MIPAAADAVIMVEDTDFTTRSPGAPAPPSITIKKALVTGENIRHQADDLRRGDKVLAAGTRFRAQEIGLLAMLGMSTVQVHRKVRLALLSTGDELLPLDSPLIPGKIHDTNTYTLAALAQAAGVEVVHLGIANDTEEDIRCRLDQAVAGKVDLVLSSAGVSVGAFDYVKAVIESSGTLDFWRVNMRPGKPLAFGAYHGIPFIGLPGNPVSSFVGFEVFVRPVLERLNGLPGVPRPARKVRVAEQIDSDGRESYLRVLVREEDGVLTAHLAGHQGSGNLFTLVQANALLIVPSGVKCVTAKSELNAWLLE